MIALEDCNFEWKDSEVEHVRQIARYIYRKAKVPLLAFSPTSALLQVETQFINQHRNRYEQVDAFDVYLLILDLANKGELLSD